jgi:molybdate transport system substrate-binding protein
MVRVAAKTASGFVSDTALSKSKLTHYPPKPVRFEIRRIRVASLQGDIMTINRAVAAAVAFGFLVLTDVSIANAAEIKVLSSVGIKAVVDELAPQFEAATKHKVQISYDLAANLKRNIEAGASFDVTILTPAMIEDLIKQGKVAPDSRTTIARTGLAVMIRAGARKPDISTVDAFKRALLDAKSITYAKEGASGVAFAALIERLMIADALKPKTRLAATGDAINESIVRGDVEFGILPVSEILPVRGAEMLGPFPADVQNYIVMVGGVSAGAKQAAAKDFIQFLMSPAVLPVIKAKGMERVGS